MRKLLVFIIGCFCIFSFTAANAVAPKKWTFLIFINGNNNLDSYGKINIKQMEKIGSNDDVNVVVQWASYSAHKAVRMLIEKSNDPNKVTSPVLQDLGKVDMGDYRSLQDFIKWGVENYPAEHYFIDVWDHGSGWHYSKSLAGRNPHMLHDISYDEITGHEITTEQLGQVMTASAQLIGHKIDIYGSDACLMAMAELGNEMSNSVDYYVGSQETEPGMGWPYAELLSGWYGLPNATPAAVSKVLVDAYVKSYQGGSSGNSQVTFSAFDLNKLENFNNAIANLAVAIQTLNPLEKSLVLAADKQSQSFAYRDYRDVVDFATRLSKAGITHLDPQVTLDVINAANELVIANSVTPFYANAHGVSIWMPSEQWTFNQYAQRYKGLKFDINTHWSDALRFVLLSTIAK